MKSFGLVAAAFLCLATNARAADIGLVPKPSKYAVAETLNRLESVVFDLPSKALAWEDESGKVWLSYDSPTYLQQCRCFAAELAKNVGAIAGLVDQALE